MRLPNHRAQLPAPGRIHELTRDFRLEDVWALPTPGGAGRLPAAGASWFASGDPSQQLLRRRPHALRDPVEARGAARLGRPGRRPRRQGADAPRPVAGGSARRPIRPGASTRSPSPRCTCSTTSGRRRSPTGPCTGSCTSAGSRTRPAATAARWPSCVKPNGLLGTAYMAAIRPFRHLIVYPPMMRQIWAELASRGLVSRAQAAGLHQGTMGD